MPTLVLEVLLGLYLGLLTGIVPALIAGGLGFLFKYLTGVTLPGLGVVVLAVAIAGVSGGLLGLIDPDIAQSPRLLVAVVVVMMLSLYSHAQGDRLGSELPRRFSFRELGHRTLSGEVVFNVGGIGRVRIAPVGEIQDLEGYPPLPADLRARIAESTWEFSADLPLEELERQLHDRLRVDFELSEVDVTLDTKGRARIAAAPPLGALSNRVPAGKRAVSIAGLMPTGIARGERVELHFPERTIEGVVLSARSDPSGSPPAAPPLATDGGDHDEAAEYPSAPRTTGGEGRLTVAVSPGEAEFALGQPRARVIVLPRGLGLEHEAVRLLKAAGNRFTRQVVSTGGAGRRLADILADDVHALAVYGGSPTGGRFRQWQIAPRSDHVLKAGDELIAVGPPEAVTRVEEALA